MTGAAGWWRNRCPLCGEKTRAKEMVLLAPAGQPSRFVCRDCLERFAPGAAGPKPPCTPGRAHYWDVPWRDGEPWRCRVCGQSWLPGVAAWG